MSINVTVNGNPVKIHRGKMVTSEIPKDYDKRRKIRLQQVREQANQLAANVRNRVKAVKNKQQTDFEQKNQSMLKEWQNRKLLQLQEHYEDCVNNMGIAHRGTKLDEAEEDEYLAKQLENEEKAEQRGKAAEELLQIQKNEANLRRAIPRQTKKFAREVEDIRASMVARQAQLHKKTPTKKTKTKGSFLVSENKEPEVLPDSNDIQTTKRTKSPSARGSHGSAVPKSPTKLLRSPPSKSAQPSATLKSPSKNLSLSRSSFKGHDEVVLSDNTSGSIENIATEDVDNRIPSTSQNILNRSPYKRSRLDHMSQESSEIPEVHLETRISDRIRNRQLAAAQPPVMCDIPEVTTSSSSTSGPLRISTQENQGSRLLQSKTNKTLSKTTNAGISIPPAQAIQIEDECPVCSKHKSPSKQPCHIHSIGHISCGDQLHESVVQECRVPSGGVCPGLHLSTHKNSVIEIPSKPTVEMPRETYVPQYSMQDLSRNQSHRKVKSFDRHNRFGQSYVTDTSQVQRINEDDLIYCEDSDVDDVSKHGQLVHERAKKAQARGKKALEKQQIRKDYDELMKKLPVLQKQERIAQLNPSKDRYHMTEERRKQHEKKRQQELENAFERIASTSVTLLPKSKKAVDPPAPKIPCKSMGTWRDENKENARESNNETENLQELLAKLKSQKEELLKESKQLPHDSNFYNLIDELDFVTKVTKHNEDKDVQTTFTSVQHKKRTSSNGTKTQIHRQVLILQNTSTQTSPKIATPQVTASSSTESSDANKPLEQLPHKKVNVCRCSADKLCEILIKICDGKAQSGECPNIPKVTLRGANRLEEALNLETSSPRRAQKAPSSSTSPRGGYSKRSRSESPKKTPRKTSPRKDVAGISKNASQITHKTDETSKICISKNQAKPRGESWRTCLNSSKAAKPNEEVSSHTSYYSPPDYKVQEQEKEKVKHADNVQKTGKSARTSKTQQKPEPNLLAYINKLLELSRDKIEKLATSSVSEVATPSSSIINTASNRPGRHQRNDDLNESTHVENLSTLLRYFNLTPADLRSGLFSMTTTSGSSAGRRTRTSSIASSSVRKSPVPMNVDPRPETEVDGYLALENYTQTPPGMNDEIQTQFTQWAEVCQERISKLTAMIDQVRMEKQQMLSPTTHEQGTITSTTLNNDATTYMNLPPPNSGQSSPNSTSLEQRQLNTRLLDVQDRHTTSITRDPNDFQTLLESAKNSPDLDVEMVQRYMRLVDVELQAQQHHSTQRVKSPTNFPGAPMLDIPKLPKLPPRPTNTMQSMPSTSKGRKPPITNNALRFNEIIHELSAIPEAENSRLSKSPQSRKSSPQKRIVRQKSPQKSAVEQTKRKPASEISTDSQSTDKSHESVEAMLKDIGLDWAIPTLKLSKSNLAANSSTSSSSLDIDLKKFSYLVSKNISTSTEKSFVSPTGDNSRHQRTSTPVLTTNSSKSQKLINSAESEISPVIPCNNSTCSQRSSRQPTRSPNNDRSFATMPSRSMNEDNSLT